MYTVKPVFGAWVVFLNGKYLGEPWVYANKAEAQEAATMLQNRNEHNLDTKVAS